MIRTKIFYNGFIDDDFIFISGNVPSSKNSNQWTGRFLVKSKTCQTYIRNSSTQYIDFRDHFIKLFGNNNKTINVKLYFVRATRHRFDYINVCQIIADLMVKNFWITDDSADYFNPSFLGYCYNKTDSGVFIIKPREDNDYTEVLKKIDLYIKKK